jgi:hypothetical protein
VQPWIGDDMAPTLRPSLGETKIPCEDPPICYPGGHHRRRPRADPPFLSLK